MKTGMDPRVLKDDERRDGGVGILRTQRRDEFGLFPNRCAAAPLREVLVGARCGSYREVGIPVLRPLPPRLRVSARLFLMPSRTNPTVIPAPLRISSLPSAYLPTKSADISVPQLR